MIVLLWVALVLEVIGIVVTLSEARKPRENVEPGAAGCAALLMVAMVAPLIWIFLTPPRPAPVLIVAGALLAGFVFGVFVMVRDIFGLRGPRTPLSVSLWTLTGIASMAGWIFLIGAV